MLIEKSSNIPGPAVTRRRLIKAGALSAASLVFPGQALALGKVLPSYEKKLSFYNMHTGERLSAVYYSMGRYLTEPLNDINHIMRDHRSGDVKAIDTKLLDLLYRLSVKIEAKEPFHIISGYRSSESNAYLRSRSSGVAKKSLHLLGKAVDVRLPGRDLYLMRDAAMSLKGGGVGYYPGPDFIHLDTGPFRYWKG
ncbi:MAG: DUF882 domain-containing protein [Deltaproteobacteria bacterium]|nr:DUF882 domain-containing protein [Deltaproteobacteria bacterium]